MKPFKIKFVPIKERRGPCGKGKLYTQIIGKTKEEIEAKKAEKEMREAVKTKFKLN